MDISDRIDTNCSSFRFAGRTFTPDTGVPLTEYLQTKTDRTPKIVKVGATHFVLPNIQWQNIDYIFQAVTTYQKTLLDNLDTNHSLVRENVNHEATLKGIRNKARPITFGMSKVLDRVL